MRLLVRPVGLLVRAWLLALSKLPPRVALRELLKLEDHVSLRIDQAAFRLDDGVHPKHRLTRYHDFFVERIEPGQRVLDVGCGYGAVSASIAERAGAHVTGIDVNRESLAQARSRHLPSKLLAFVESDVHFFEPSEPFDVVVLSNVLEHLVDRPALLRRLVERTGARRVLIRVPVFDRDWRVPLRAELGLSPFEDATHEIEYRPGELEQELEEAGLRAEETLRHWGELWVSAVPVAA